MNANELPIQAIAEAFRRWISRGSRVVVTAPTGSGKSTRVPRFLWECPEVHGKILVLEPRRLAARVLAEHVASEWGEACGESVGYRTRFEHCGTAATRVWFLTEGILIRMLANSPDVPGIGAVVFDEFHERSLISDMGLGLVRLLQDKRPDLKLVVMSATLDAAAVCRYLDDAPHLHAGGRLHPVQVTYAPKPVSRPVWEEATAAARNLTRREVDGDILMFMPGIREIRHCVSLCRQQLHGLDVLPLYGDLPPEQQHRVMTPGSRRRLIIATNLAETSLTIPGIRHVIDSGLVRLNRYDPVHGINKLETFPICRDSAEQRAGRAGREAPGTCHRLWTKAEHQRKEARTPAEIHRADLSEAVLSLLTLYPREPATFPWFESPAATAVERALDLLRELGFVETDGFGLTARGRMAARIPVHPRLAQLLLLARDEKVLSAAFLAAAVLSERPLLLPGKRFPEVGPVASDLWAAVELVRRCHQAGFAPEVCRRHGVHVGAARQIWRTGEHLQRTCRVLGWHPETGAEHVENFARCVLRAFPDRLAKRRDAGTLICEMRDGRTVSLARESGCKQATLMVAGELRHVAGPGRSGKALLSLATEIEEEWLLEFFPEDWREEDILVWDERKRRVLRRCRLWCLGVLIEERLRQDVDPEQAAALLASRIAAEGLPLKGWSKEVDAWIARVRWVARMFPERNLPTFDETEKAVLLREACAGRTQYKQVKDLPFLDIVKQALGRTDIQFVEQMAPAVIKLPSGRRLKLDYATGEVPRGKATIQDLYDVKETPAVAGGRVRVLLDILAPNRRTVQVTDDLAGFWRDVYPGIKKQYAARYTRHEWR